jgi:hypothetical protein
MFNSYYFCQYTYIYSGEQVLTRNIKDEKLQQWFVNLGAEVQSLLCVCVYIYI